MRFPAAPGRIGGLRSDGRRSNCRSAFLGVLKVSHRAQQLTAMTKRRDADLFEVLISQVAKNFEINIVLGKTLGVLGHAELWEPIRNLLHRLAA